MDDKRAKGPDGGIFGLIILLGFFLLVTFEIGNGTNDVAAFCAVLFCIGAVIMYLMPTIIASAYKHPSRGGIGILNFFLGWTVLGWVVALVWAYSPPKHQSAVSAEDEGMTACPYCAEPIRSAAIKCKHCGSDLSAPAAT